MPILRSRVASLASVAELQQLAQQFAQLLQPRDVILLDGDLGVGKTTFTRAIINSLAGDTVVPSPTFNLVFVYDTPAGALWHFDLYRLKKASELTELSIEDALETGIIFAEWPEKLLSYRPDDYLILSLSYGKTSGERTYSWSCPQASAWQARLKSRELWL